MLLSFVKVYVWDYEKFSYKCLAVLALFALVIIRYSDFALGGSVFPNSFMTFWRSAQACFFSDGLRRR